MNYSNESYQKGNSKFIQVDPVNGTVVEFRSKVSPFKVDGVASKALSFTVRLSKVQDITPCGETCIAAEQMAFLELRGNMQPGTDVAAFKAELDRLYAKAADDYFLHDGVVPNVNADLSE